MCSTKTKWISMVIAILFSILAMVVYLLVAQFLYKISIVKNLRIFFMLTVDGVICILVASVELLFGVRYFFGRKEKKAAKTMLYTSLLTQALLLFGFETLWIVAVLDELSWAGAGYRLLFSLSGGAVRRLSVLTVAVYGVYCLRVRLSRCKKEKQEVVK